MACKLLLFLQHIALSGDIRDGDEITLQSNLHLDSNLIIQCNGDDENPLIIGPDMPLAKVQKRTNFNDSKDIEIHSSYHQFIKQL